jgi:competence protein ComEA
LLACALLSPAIAKPPPRHPVNINTATAEQLKQLPGIGPARAAQIIRLRQKNGPFHSVDELRALPHLSEKQFRQLKKHATVGDAATPKARSDSGEEPCQPRPGR